MTQDMTSNAPAPVELTSTQVERISQALAAPRRYQILKDVGNAGGTCSCTVLLELHAISAATLSHHLKELERAELLGYVREGKFKSVVLRRDTMQAYIAKLNQV